MNNIRNLIASLCAFDIKDDTLVKAYSVLSTENETACFEAYSTIFRTLTLKDTDLSSYLRDVIRYSESPVLKNYGNRMSAEAVEHDVRVLEVLTHYTSERLKTDLCERFGNKLFLSLPDFDAGDHVIDADSIKEFAASGNIGIFARYRAFTFDGERLVPVENTDTITLADLKNYEVQRDQIIENTECFLSGKPAQNVLLYGDRGTGKSSTVKALLSEFDKLRMVELSKNDVEYLPELYTLLAGSSFRFIILIDDLTFSENDDRYNALKAALEGSLSARPGNILIYATTNRRKIIKETTAERLRDEVSPTDAVDESMSLADRFGLFVTFGKPNKEVYLDIVKKIAADRELDIPEEQLFMAAERFAIRRSGRSPRIARQFVDWAEGRLSLGLEI